LTAYEQHDTVPNLGVTMPRKCEIELDEVLKAIATSFWDDSGSLYNLAAELLGNYLSDQEIDAFVSKYYTGSVVSDEVAQILYLFQRCYITHGV
jgi:hypothetical protein